ncbi:pentapeptide repeat-containing protein [Vallitalea sp.]|jgi:uncharacterized protein YjbI with pentapeptide repeats|uniref:pentapeptide repeat-containing protein n=1 Tax=Vallitalea sp. TaxID=1882829 RepID=UPI0025D24CCA|nr:pentapeptide repeat-containing protein [Vallitalea sp.]MCT4688484.1 pentapeptide repeat-containing protein [Vallitalea sp.]
MKIASNTRYEDVDFNDSNLEFLDIQKSFRLNVSDTKNSAFLNCKFGFADLFSAKFTDCKMVGSTFDESNLLGVVIVRGDFSYTNLKFHDFKGLDFSEVNLTRADLTGCNLEKVIFNGAKLSYTNLHKAKLNGCDFREAIIEGINLSELDLHNVKLDIAGCILLATSFGAKVE